MMNNRQILVIGGGAAGLMAAGFAARTGAGVTLLERNARPARKILITGKGRCNVTNDCNDIRTLVEAVPANGRFLYSAFSAFMPADTIAFFERAGVPLKTERGGRVFPQSDKSYDIADALERFARECGVQIVQGRAVHLRAENGRISGAVTEAGQLYRADAVIVATGGLSYPRTGSTGDGYALAQEAGHTLVPTHPSLSALNVHEGWCSDLQGLSLRNSALKVEDTQKGKVIYTDFGEMLFTHFGVSGPMILSASSHMRQMESGRYRIHIDLKPALDPEQLDRRILRDFEGSKNRNFINALDLLLPKKLVPVIVRLSGIPASRKVNAVTREERRALGVLLKDLTLTVTGFCPIEEAIVTAGGVPTKEIDPKTMQSKLLPGLYFAGEVIDVDAYTGGYNLQIAFATGKLAGLSAAGQEENT